MIGGKLKTLREDKGLTQNEVASALKVTLRAYQSYERNERDISTDLLVQILDYFEVSCESLLEHQAKETDVENESLIRAIESVKSLKKEESYLEVESFAHYLKWKEGQG